MKHEAYEPLPSKVAKQPLGGSPKLESHFGTPENSVPQSDLYQQGVHNFETNPSGQNGCVKRSPASTKDASCAIAPRYRGVRLPFQANPVNSVPKS